MALRRNISHRRQGIASRILKGALALLLAAAAIAGGFIFWFNGQHVKDPLLKILTERSGMPFTVGRVEFSPLYPDTLKLHDVGFGRSTIGELYAEYDLRSLLDKKRLVIRDLFVKDVKAADGDVGKMAQGRLGFDSVQIDALHAVNVPVDASGLKAESASFEISSLLLGQDGRAEAGSGSGELTQGSFRSLPFKSLSGRFEIRQGTAEISSLSLDALGGTISGSLSMPDPDTLDFSELSLDRVVLKDAGRIPQDLKITATEASVSSMVALLPSRGIALSGMDGRFLDLTIAGGRASFIYTGRIGEVSVPDMQLTAEDTRAEVSAAESGADIKLGGSVFGGSFSLDAFAGSEGGLSVRSLSLSGGRLELTPDLRDGLARRLNGPVTVGTLTLNGVSFLSHLDSLRLSARSASGTVSGFSWSGSDGFAPAPAGAASLSASDVLYHDLRCSELSLISNFSSQGVTISVPKAVFGKSQATFAMSLPLDDGKGFAIAQARGFDASALNSDLLPRTLGGNFDLDAQLRTQGPASDFVKNLEGHVTIRSESLLVSDFGLDLINGGKKGVFSLPWDKLQAALSDSDCGFHDLLLQLEFSGGRSVLNATASLPASRMSMHAEASLEDGKVDGEAFFASYPRDSLTTVRMGGSLPAPQFEIDAIDRGPVLRPGLFVKQLSEDERRERDEELRRQAEEQRQSAQKLEDALKLLKDQIAQLEAPDKEQEADEGKPGGDAPAAGGNDGDGAKTQDTKKAPAEGVRGGGSQDQKAAKESRQGKGG